MKIATSCPCCGCASLTRTPAVLMPFVARRVFGWEPVVIPKSWGLQTIRTGEAYNICASLRCGRCGLLFLDMRFDDDEMKALYKDYRKTEYAVIRAIYEPGYLQRNLEIEQGNGYVHEVESFLTGLLDLPIDILDWGGGQGTNTPFRPLSGRRDIYDIDPQPAWFGSKVAEPIPPYQLIVCASVLEHVPYPVDLLTQIRAQMTGRTVLYLEVPHETVMRRAEDKHHWHEHINFFTKTSVSYAIHAAGLRCIAFRELDTATDVVFQFACVMDQGGRI